MTAASEPLWIVRSDWMATAWVTKRRGKLSTYPRGHALMSSDVADNELLHLSWAGQSLDVRDLYDRPPTNFVANRWDAPLLFASANGLLLIQTDWLDRLAGIVEPAHVLPAIVNGDAGWHLIVPPTFPTPALVPGQPIDWRDTLTQVSAHRAAIWTVAGHREPVVVDAVKLALEAAGFGRYMTFTHQYSLEWFLIDTPRTQARIEQGLMPEPGFPPELGPPPGFDPPPWFE